MHNIHNLLLLRLQLCIKTNRGKQCLVIHQRQLNLFCGKQWRAIGPEQGVEAPGYQRGFFEILHLYIFGAFLASSVYIWWDGAKRYSHQSIIYWGLLPFIQGSRPLRTFSPLKLHILKTMTTHLSAIKYMYMTLH